jgi:hypothetical protein
MKDSLQTLKNKEGDMTTIGPTFPAHIADLILNSGNASDVVGTYSFGTYGTLVSVICTVENTGNGSGIANFFAASGNTPGALIATAPVSANSTYGFSQDEENQIMFGSVYHVLTDYGWNSFPRGDDSAKLAEAESRLWG